MNEQFRGNQTESGFGQNADNLTIYTKLDIPNDIPDNSFISSLNVGIRKQGAPTDNYVLTVYDEADLNTAIFSISKGGADLTTTNTKTLLGTNIPVQAGHTYRFVFSRSSGTADGTNYYVL
ncbi:MAG: hypothetical protein LBU27_02955 [Candidatus Peribacteria bacterium]|nr:hypothetical protein [Candidatus Peribacteria bacterium]